jgi:hypothetical protein
MRLVPVAEPVGQSGGSYRRHWCERRARHPAVGPGGLVWRLIGDAGKDAARLPNKHEVAGHEDFLRQDAVEAGQLSALKSSS